MFLAQSSSDPVAVAQLLTPTAVGSAPAGFNAIEFMGRLERSGKELA
jgi:hypothetical protein